MMIDILNRFFSKFTWYNPESCKYRRIKEWLSKEENRNSDCGKYIEEILRNIENKEINEIYKLVYQGRYSIYKIAIELDKNERQISEMKSQMYIVCETAKICYEKAT